MAWPCQDDHLSEDHWPWWRGPWKWMTPQKRSCPALGTTNKEDSLNLSHSNSDQARELEEEGLLGYNSLSSQTRHTYIGMADLGSL